MPAMLALDFVLFSFMVLFTFTLHGMPNMAIQGSKQNPITLNFPTSPKLPVLPGNRLRLIIAQDM